jgi:hypothetical protein
MPVIHFGKICKTCKRGIPPAEAASLGDELRGFSCESCKMKHLAAISAFQQNLNSGVAADCGQRCGDCDMTLDQIEALTGKRSMYMAEKDGVVGLLCLTCLEKYEAKKLENTTFRGIFKHLTRAEFEGRFYNLKMSAYAKRFLLKHRIDSGLVKNLDKLLAMVKKRGN